MEYLKLERQDNILLLTIDRQMAFNALNHGVLNELKEAIQSIDTETIRCLVITGAGKKAFVAGADIAAMQPMSKEEGKAFGIFGNSVFRMLEKLEIPVIAAINGFALGGGCELAIACDIRLASQNAVFAQPEVGLGITAGFGGTQRLPRLVGEGHAKCLLLSGERINAQRAFEIGLVHRVCAEDELIDKALELARTIAAQAPIAVKATKRAIEEGRSMNLDEALLLESRLFGDCFESGDQREAMSAMLEKRKPKPFTGEQA